MVQTLSQQNERTLMWLKFLQDLQYLQPNTALRLEHYAWSLPLDTWPEHNPYLQPLEANLDSSCAESAQNLCLLRVDKPRMSPCPAPDSSLLPWLSPQWSDPNVSAVECYACKLKLKLPVAKHLAHVFHVEQSQVQGSMSHESAAQPSTTSSAQADAPHLTSLEKSSLDATDNTQSAQNAQSAPLSKSLSSSAQESLGLAVKQAEQGTQFGRQGSPLGIQYGPCTLSEAEFQVLNGTSPFLGAPSQAKHQEPSLDSVSLASGSVEQEEVNNSTLEEPATPSDLSKVEVIEIVRYTSNPEWIDTLCKHPSALVVDISLWAEQEALHKPLQTWLRQRQMWQQEHMSEQVALKLYTKLQLAYTALQQASGQVELLLGNGLLRALDSECQQDSRTQEYTFATSEERALARNLLISHPVVLKPVRLCFDERLERFTVYDSPAPCRLYQPALQALSALLSLNQAEPALDTRQASQVEGESDSQAESAVNALGAERRACDLVANLSTLARQATTLHPLECRQLLKFLELLGTQLPHCLVTPQASNDLSLLNNYTCTLSFSPCLLLHSYVAPLQQPLSSVLEQVAHGATLSTPALQLLQLAHKDSLTGSELQVKLPNLAQRLKDLSAARLDLLLPYELNPQQLSLVEKAATQPLVLAQAPIGSGKSYTAATLVGQALAQGKSVLVTSAREIELDHISSYLGGELSQLCGRLGSAGITAIGKNLEALANFEQDKLEAELTILQEQRTAAFNELLQQRTKLFNWLNSANIEIVYQGNTYTCAQLSSFVKEHADLAKVIPFTPHVEQEEATATATTTTTTVSPDTTNSAFHDKEDGESHEAASKAQGAGAEVQRSRFELPALPLSLDELKELYATNESVPAQYEEQLKLAWPERKALPQPEQFLDLLQTLSKLQQSLEHSQVWQLELNLAQNLVGFKARTPAAHAIFGAQVDISLQDLQLSKLGLVALGQLSEIPTWIAEVYKLGKTPESPQFKAWLAVTQRIMTWHELATKVSRRIEGRKLELNPQCTANAQAMQQLESALSCACRYAVALEQAEPSSEVTQVASAQQVRPEQFKAACALIDRAVCLNKQAVRKAKDFSLALDYVRMQVVKQQAMQQWQSVVAPISKVSFSALDSENPEKVAWRFGYLLHWILHWPTKRQVVQDLWQSKYQAIGLKLRLNLQQADPKSQSLQGAVMVWQVLQQAGQELVFLTQQAHRYYRYCISYNRVLKLLNQDQFKQNPCCSLLLQALTQRQPPLYAKAYRQMNQILDYQAEYLRRRELLERLQVLAPDWAEELTERRKEHGQATLPAQVEVAWQYWQFAQCLAQITSGSPQASKQQLSPLKHKFFEVSLQYVTKLAQLKLLTHLAQADLSSIGIDLTAVQGTSPSQGKSGVNEALLRSLEHWPVLPHAPQAAFKLLPVWLLPISFVLSSYELFRQRFDLLIIDEAQTLSLSASSVLLFNLAEHVVLLGDEQQLKLNQTALLAPSVQQLLSQGSVSSADNCTTRESLLRRVTLSQQYRSLAQAYPEQIALLHAASSQEQSLRTMAGSTKDASFAESSCTDSSGVSTLDHWEQGLAYLAPHAQADYTQELTALSLPQTSLFTWLQSFMSKFTWCEQFTCVPQLFAWGNQHGYAHKLQSLRQPRFSTLAPSILLLQGGQQALYVLTALLKACGEQNEYASRSMGVMVLGEVPHRIKVLIGQKLGLHNPAESCSLAQDTAATQPNSPESVDISTLELLSYLIYNELSVSLQKQHHLRVGTPEFFTGQSCDVMFVLLGEQELSSAHYNMALMHTNEQLWLINATDVAHLDSPDIRMQLLNYADKCQAEFAQDLQDDSAGEKGAMDGKLAQRSAMHTSQALMQVIAQDSSLAPEQISFMQLLAHALSEHGFQLLLSSQDSSNSVYFPVSGGKEDPSALVVVYQQRRLRLECHTEQELLHQESILEIVQRHERYEHYGYSVLHLMCSTLDTATLDSLIVQIQREGFQSENLRGFIYVLLHQSSVVLLHKIQERALTLLAQSFALDFSLRSLFAGPIAKSLAQRGRSLHSLAQAQDTESKVANAEHRQDKETVPSASSAGQAAEHKVSLAQLAKDLSDDEEEDEDPKLQPYAPREDKEPQLEEYSAYVADNEAQAQSLTSELEKVITQSEQEQATAAYQAGPERKRIGEKAEAETELKYNYQLARIGLKQIAQPIENPLPAEPHERFRAFKRFLFALLRQMRLSYKDLLSSYQIVAVTPNAGQTQYFLRMCEYLHLRPYIFNSTKPMAKRVWCIKQSDLMSSYVHESALALCAKAPTGGEEVDSEELADNSTPDVYAQPAAHNYMEPAPQAYPYIPPMAAGDENSPLISALNKALNPYWGQTVDDRQRDLPQTMRALQQRRSVQSWEPPHSTNQFLREQLMPPPMRRNLNRGDVNTLAVLSMIPKEQNLPNPSKAKIHTLRVTKGGGASDAKSGSGQVAPRRGAVQYAKTSGQGQAHPDIFNSQEVQKEQEAQESVEQSAQGTKVAHAEPVESQDSSPLAQPLSDSQLQVAVEQLKQVQRHADSEFNLSSIFDIPEVSNAVSASIAEASNLLSAQEQVSGVQARTQEAVSSGALGGGSRGVRSAQGTARKQESYGPASADKARKDTYPVYGAGAAANSRIKRAGAVDYPFKPQESPAKAQLSQSSTPAKIEHPDTKQAALDAAAAAARARLAEQKSKAGQATQSHMASSFNSSETSTGSPAMATAQPAERFNADAAVAELLMQYEQEQETTHAQEPLVRRRAARFDGKLSAQDNKQPTAQDNADNVVVRGSIMGIGEIEGEMLATPSAMAHNAAYASRVSAQPSKLQGGLQRPQSRPSYTGIVHGHKIAPSTSSGRTMSHSSDGVVDLSSSGVSPASAQVKPTYQAQPQVHAASLAGAQALSQAAYGSHAYRGQGQVAGQHGLSTGVSRTSAQNVSRGTSVVSSSSGQAKRQDAYSDTRGSLSTEQAGYLAMLLERSQIWFKQDGVSLQVKVLPSQESAFQDICKAMRLQPRLKASSQGISRYAEWIF